VVIRRISKAIKQTVIFVLVILIFSSSLIKEMRHIEMPKAAPKVHLSFSKTRDDIEMK